MDVLQMLALGFSVALTPTNLFLCLVGVVIGTLIGALPGLGPSGTVAILLPFTFGRDPTGSMIMLAGIYYGGMYGGSLTSILLNTPGESASVMTCIDGYQMARKGRAGAALGISAIASFIGGTAGVIGLMLIAPPLAAFAVAFGPPEYFALMVMGLTAVTAVGGKSMIKALLSGLFGLMLAMVGTDSTTGWSRFTYDQPHLLDGIPFIAAAMGMFGVTEVLANVEQRFRAEVIRTRWRDVYPTIRDLRDCIGAFWRGGIIGFIIGVLPGAGATIASFIAYATEKKASRHPEKFGAGVIEGVAAPEGANNAATAGAMVPLLTLGIPGSGTTAVMLGALMMFGLKPGPLLMEKNPDFFWGVIASMYIGNVLLLIINLPLVPLFANVLNVPYWLLGPSVIMLCFVGVYSLNNSLFDLWLLLLFSVLGYLMKKLEFPVPPVVLGLVLGPLTEMALKRSLQISHGDISILFFRPIAGTLMLVTFAILLFPAVRALYSRWSASRQAAAGIG